MQGKGKDWGLLLLLYVIGGLAGTAIGYFTFHEDGIPDMFDTFNPEFIALYSTNERMIQVIFLELICSTLFISTYLMVTQSPAARTEDTTMKGLTMAGALFVCIYLSAGSASLMNPAFIIIQIIL